MARYYFDVQTGKPLVRDDEGAEFDSLDAAVQAAARSAAEIGTSRLARGDFSDVVIEVRDERNPAGRHGDGVDADRVGMARRVGARVSLESISPSGCHGMLWRELRPMSMIDPCRREEHLVPNDLTGRDGGKPSPLRQHHLAAEFDNPGLKGTTAISTSPWELKFTPTPPSRQDLLL